MKYSFNKVIIGIDASRNRSGGAKAHIVGILSTLNPDNLGIKEVHIWSYKNLLDILPERDWLIKHNPKELEKSLFHQFYWQATKLSKQLKENSCDILFSTLGNTLCKFQPSVVLCQNLLPFEPKLIDNEIGKIFRFKNHILRKIETNAFKKASGHIFLSSYSADQVQKFTGKLESYKIIQHGVDDLFRVNCYQSGKTNRKKIDLIYVSTIFKYKNHENIIRAVNLVEKRGYNVAIKFVGGGKPDSDIKKLISSFGSDQFEFLGNQSHEELIRLFKKSDIFVFGSSCETFGITLLEGMASGMPTVCSDKSSLPELLGDAGMYFDPGNIDSIADALEEVINSERKRKEMSIKAQKRAQNFRWEKSSQETFKYLVDVASKQEANNKL